MVSFHSASKVSAKIEIDGTSDFEILVIHYLSLAKSNSNNLKLLIEAAEKSSKTITIRPISNDRKTWHYSGQRSRSHTEALDGKKRGAARTTPTNAVIFINPKRVDKGHRSFGNGTLIHEIVHALDLVNGKYHRNYVIREKRAVFFQNIWRSLHGKKLRTHYHEQFKTNEYQSAVQQKLVDNFIQYYFENNDIPD